MHDMLAPRLCPTDLKNMPILCKLNASWFLEFANKYFFESGGQIQDLKIKAQPWRRQQRVIIIVGSFHFTPLVALYNVL